MGFCAAAFDDGFQKFVFIIDNDDREESKLIMKHYLFCLAAVMQSYKKHQRRTAPDDTSLDE
jgi:hypothetical protein